MKAIETIYNGYRFRSRLEARWAVFFDACGIPYEYEVEGFDSDGSWYLPDFYLPEVNRWFEVKGQKLSEPELDKILRFCIDKDKEGKEFKYSILLGSPNPLWYWIKNDNGLMEKRFAGIQTYRYSSPTTSHKLIDINKNVICELPKGQQLLSTVPELADFAIMLPFYETGWIDFAVPVERLFEAIDKAKHARFEHGERG